MGGDVYFSMYFEEVVKTVKIEKCSQ